MPRRASFDPGAVEATIRRLNPEIAGGLDALRITLDVESWERASWAPAFVASAAVLLTAELIQNGATATAALDRASARLGVSPDSVKTWCRRWSARGVQVEPRIRPRGALRLASNAMDALPRGDAA